MRRVTLIIGIALGASTAAAHAAETIRYTYDAKGRVVKVVRTGSVNSGRTTEYQHDKANNRKRVKRTTAP